MKTYRMGIAIAVMCALAALSAPPVSAKDKWINLTTKNFNIVSNAGEGDTRELALKLEQFRHAFSQILDTRAVASVPVTVVAFKNDSSFKPFKPIYDGKPANIAGYFQRGEDENIIALSISEKELRPLELIFHEYTHLLTSYTTFEIPLWFAEGLAELYSTFDVNKNEVTLGKPDSNHVHFLRRQSFLPLQTLFAVDTRSPEYNESSKQGVFYAQSWALVHYLMFGDEGVRQPQLIQFLKLLVAGANAEAAFKQAFKTDYATMEKDLRRYIGNDSYSGRILTLASTEGEKDVTVRALSDAEAHSYLGTLLLRTNRLEEAAAYFKQAAAMDPALARPHEGLGYVATRRENYTEAKEHFKQAAARDSKNHVARYYYAESLFEEAMKVGSDDIKPDLARTITEELKAAIKLMPGYAPPYNLLGFMSLVTNENIEEGLNLLRTARKIEPQNKHYALTFAQLQVRLQQYAAAKRTLEPLLKSDADQELKSSAQSLMSYIETYMSGPPRDMGPPPGAGGPPTLKRKEEPSKGETDTARSQAGRTIKIEGAQVIKGVLAAIECEGAGMVLVVRSEGNLLRFKVSDPAKLQFFSQDPNLHAEIGCRPINLPAFISFKPTQDGKSKFAGDAVAVEFIKQ